jgi:methylase of polypeptide subunit release factors
VAGTVEIRFGGRRASLALAPDVHHDAGNEPLYGPLAELVRGNERVLDLGCGHGVLGIVAGLAGASSVTFVDVHPPSVALALANAASNGLGSGARVCEVRGACGDFLAPVKGETFDLVLCNPPQTGGPAALRELHPARFGGADGAAYLVRLAEEAEDVVPDLGARIVYFHLSRANPRRVAHAFEAAGFELERRASQARSFTLAELDALAPGTGSHQLALRARGEAEFTGGEPNGSAVCTMQQALWVATRAFMPR